MRTIKAVFFRTGYLRGFMRSLRVLFIHQLAVLFRSNPRRITEETFIKLRVIVKKTEISRIINIKSSAKTVYMLIFSVYSANLANRKYTVIDMQGLHKLFNTNIHTSG